MATRTEIAPGLTNAQLIALLNENRSLVDAAKLRHGDNLTDAAWLAMLGRADIINSRQAAVEEQIRLLREQSNLEPF